MIYQKTDAGQTAFKSRSVELSSRQRSAFLLFDGKRTLNEVLKATAGLGITVSDIDALVDKGLLAPSAGPIAAQAMVDTVPAAIDSRSPTSAEEPPADALTTAQLYQRAYPIATRITAQLGLRGFRLNLAVEAASGYDDLVTLLPKIAIAAGDQAAAELKRALGL